MGQGARAAEALERAIARHGGQPWQWAMQLGDWRLALGDPAGALDAYRQALEWQPGEATIRERVDQVSE
jgi:cytochrome c-type biogenesis protein CcmH/NrfG